MNNTFDNDYLWLTVMEVLKDGASMVPATTGTGAPTGAAAVPPPAPLAPIAGAPAGPLYQLRVQGLWRKNDRGNEQVVNKYFEEVKKLTDFFGPTEDKPEVTLGIQDDRYAYDFKFRLPLVKGMKFDK